METWADKHAPKTVGDLVGNGGVARALEEWLQKWDSVHLDTFTPGELRAVLLSGPPGIGKSSMVRLVCAQLGREVVEMNASDARSKNKIEEALGNTTQVRARSFNAPAQRKEVKRVLVREEVDGMSGSDRGGMAALVAVIKASRIPVICTCNDRSKSTIRTLANHCLDLRCSRPAWPDIVKRMRAVARMEGLQTDDETLRELVQGSGNDLRQVLLAMQMWAAKKGASMVGAGDRLEEIGKDAGLRMGAFDGGARIFGEKGSVSLAEREEGFFADYDLVPLMVAENYVRAACDCRTSSDDVAVLRRVSLAADAVCEADMLRARESWSSLPQQAMMNVRAAHLCNGRPGRVSFPEWLGKNSNASKRARMLAELTVHMRSSELRPSVSKRSMRMEYVPVIRDTFVRPLVDGKGPEQTLDYMDEYSMSRDDLFESIADLQFKGDPDPFAQIAPSAKGAFTRAYNKRGQRSQILGEEATKTTKTRRNEEEDNDEEAMLLEAEEEPTPEEEASVFRAKPKKVSTSSKRKKVAAQDA